MDSIYKQELCRRIDGVSALERSGYGSTYRRETLAEKKESLAAFPAFLAFVIVLTVLACVIN